MADKSYKVVRVPKDKQRVGIVPRSKFARMNDAEYQKELEADFSQDRQLYETVIINDVPVKVKVAPK